MIDMMKRLWTIWMSLLLISCFQDQGNYNYVDNELIQISGILDRYTVVQFVDTLSLNPEITSNYADADFDYIYWVYDENLPSESPDTLSVGTKNLENYIVGLESKVYKLIFQVTNTKTGVQAFHESELNVTTSSNHGWYIFKSSNGLCDLDFYNMSGEKSEDVLLLSSGRQLEGERAERLTVGTNYADPFDYDEGTNTFKKTTVLFPVSDKDAKAVKLSTGKILNDFSEMFLEAPAEPYAPGMAFAGAMAQFITNNGQVYYYWPYTSAMSKFAAKLEFNSDFEPYRLSKYIMYATPNPIAFDELSSSFVSIPGNSTYLIGMVDGTGTELSATENNMDLLWAGSKGLYDIEHYAIMSDKEDASQKYMAFLTCLGNTATIKLDCLLSDDPLYSASLFALNHSTTKFLYFVSENKVYARSIAAIPGVNSVLDLELPKGEIAFLKHIYCNDYANPANSMNKLLVGAINGDAYEIKGYDLDAGGRPASAQASLHFTGNGCPGDVLFVFPGITSTTFVPSY